MKASLLTGSMLTGQGYGYGPNPRSIIAALKEHQPLNDSGLTIAKLREAKRLLMEMRYD